MFRYFLAIYIFLFYTYYIQGDLQRGNFFEIDINFRHLEYFIKVARLGSINKAAQALYISQPYLGKIMHDLEEISAPGSLTAAAQA